MRENLGKRKKPSLDLSPGQLGEKHKCYLCAMAPPHQHELTSGRLFLENTLKAGWYFAVTLKLALFKTAFYGRINKQQPSTFYVPATYKRLRSWRLKQLVITWTLLEVHFELSELGQFRVKRTIEESQQQQQRRKWMSMGEKSMFIQLTARKPESSSRGRASPGLGPNTQVCTSWVLRRSPENSKGGLKASTLFTL